MDKLATPVVPFIRLDAKAIKALDSIGRASYMEQANHAMQAAAHNGSALIGHIFYTASIEYGIGEFTRTLALETVPAEFVAYARSFWAPFKRAYAAGKAEIALTAFGTLAKKFPASEKKLTRERVTAAEALADAVETIDALAEAQISHGEMGGAEAGYRGDDAALASALAAVTAERDALRSEVDRLTVALAAAQRSRFQRAPAPIVPSIEQSQMAGALLKAGLIEAIHVTH